MNKTIFFIVGSWLLLLPGLGAQVQSPSNEISISGSAEVNVAPDLVYISVAIDTRDAQLDAAIRQNNERMARALEFIKEAGVPDKDVQTDSIDVQPDYGARDAQIEALFYRVRKSIQIKLDAVTNFETVVTGLLSHEVNVFCSVDFGTTKLREYRDQARAMAVKAAKEKAEALCKELNVKCGKPTNVKADDYDGYYSRSVARGGSRYMSTVVNSVMDMGGGSAAPGDTMSVGQIRISSTVYVSFQLE